MFFSGTKVLLFLKRQGLEIYYKNSDKVMELEFQPNALRHLEVISRDEIVKTLVDGFKRANLYKQKAVIVLSNHIVFERLIPQEDPGNAQRETAKFYSDVPLDEAHIARKIMPFKGSALALAANRELYQLIIEVAHEFEWKIKAVIPMTPFAKLSEDTRLTPDQVKKFLGSDQIFKEANFLNESLPGPEGTEETKKKDLEESGNRGKNIAALLITLFLLSIIAGLLIYFKIVKLPFNLPWEGYSTVLTSPAPEASQPAQPALRESTTSANTQEASVSAQINRDDIRIHVLNGSGIAGQANKIKEKLIEIGYLNVITGNIESSEASGSSIIYSEDLEESVKDEINKLMESLVNEITKTDEAINEFNLVITLGKLNQAIE